MILDILILALILQIVIHCINHKLKLSIFISDQTPWFEGPTIKESELFSETKKRVRWELGVIRMILKLHLIFLLSLHSCNVTECYCFTRNMRVTFLFLLVCVAASLAIHIGVNTLYEITFEILMLIRLYYHISLNKVPILNNVPPWIVSAFWKSLLHKKGMLFKFLHFWNC